MRFSKYASVVCAFVLTACGGAGNSIGSSSNSAAAAAKQVNIAHIQDSVTSAQTSVASAQSALSTIFTSSGSFNWTIFLGNVNFQNLSATTQTCIKAAFPTQDPLSLVLTGSSDIAAALTCIFNDVITVAGIANTDLTEAMTTLQSALASVPAGSAEATEIQSMITEVQSLQTQYNSSMSLLANQMNVVTNYIQNVLPELVTSLVPVPVAGMFAGMAVQAFVQPIVASVQQFQTELRAL